VGGKIKVMMERLAWRPIIEGVRGSRGRDEKGRGRKGVWKVGVVVGVGSKTPTNRGTAKSPERQEKKG